MKQALIIILLLNGATAGAQYKITLYDQPGFTGSFTIITSPMNLAEDRYNFDDLVSSIIVQAGDWELYKHRDYHGRRTIARVGMEVEVDCDNCYSSVRPICKYVKDESVAKLILYEHKSLQGKAKTYYVDEPDFDSFNDIFRSGVSVKGDWELYEHKNFQGERTILREGEQKNLDNNDFYSSARPICASYRKKSKCSIKKVEVLHDENFTKKLIGTKVIGSVAGASCDTGMQSLILEHTESVTESMGISISKSEGYNWSVSKSLSVTTSATNTIRGNSGTVTAGISASSGGTISLTVTQSKSFTNSS